jgi:putative phage-type endonuclease
MEAHLIQGSDEWLHLRTSKITATDSSVIMGVSKWKTKIELYNDKISETTNSFVNDRMKRGTDLEPMARELFCIQNSLEVSPRVVVKDWAMASLDGMSECGNYIVEIKCPGEKDHALALSGKVPEHYYPQIQHQLFVTGLDSAFYYSFDGTDGVTLVVQRDDDYIEKMVAEELKFYECLESKIVPEPSTNDYVERNDDLWNLYASQWISVLDRIKDLEREQEELRNELIFLSSERNTRGSGISVQKVERKGNVDYSKIPELSGVDLEKYRKEPTSNWRITSQ